MTGQHVQGPTHGERRFETPVEKALLRELPRLCERRDHQAGVVGNLVGAEARAASALGKGRRFLDQLEEKAARVRASYDVLHNGPAIDSTADNAETVDGFEAAIAEADELVAAAG